jgi:hypothetical protein
MTVVDLSEARMRKMTPKEAFDNALDRWEAEDGRAWETPVEVLGLILPVLSAEKRKRLLIMLQARLAGYTPERIANAEAKIRMLQAAEILEDPNP